jgi:hypothetical protein
MLGAPRPPCAISRHQPVFQEGRRLRADSAGASKARKKAVLGDPRSEIAVRRAEIAVGTPNKIGLEEDPENICSAPTASECILPLLSMCQ